MPTKIKSTNITDDAVTAPAIATDAVGAPEIAAGAVAASEIASTFDISSKTVTLPAASVTAHATDYDDNQLKEDIALLAFKQATSDSVVKYDLVDQSIDVFSDSSGINAGASINEIVDATGKYVTGFVASNTGGVVTTYGSYTIHEFTASGNFTIANDVTADIVLVGGGGAGGESYGDNDTGKGGGGAGGLLYATNYTVASSSSPYSIVIGAGGTGLAQGTNSPSAGDNGDNTTGFGVTAVGGGGGGKSDSSGGTNAGSSGGSGGGGGARSSGDGNYAGGSGTQATSGSFTGFGYGGGASANGNFSGGGGGGAGQAGYAYSGANNASNGGAGGDGKDYSSIFGTGVGVLGWFAGGGGGGTYKSVHSEYQAPGGDGGGGKGVYAQEYSQGGAFNTNDVNGIANSGGGGGGSSEDAQRAANEGSMNGSGGSGVVVIRYPISQGGAANNLTLVSNVVTAETQPTKADLVMTYTNGAGTATIGTDLTAEVTRDGTNWTSFGLSASSDQGDTGGHTILTAHDIDISGQPAGSAMQYRIKTLNQSTSKETRIHAVSLGWS